MTSAFPSRIRSQLDSIGFYTGPSSEKMREAASPGTDERFDTSNKNVPQVLLGADRVRLSGVEIGATDGFVDCNPGADGDDFLNLARRQITTSSDSARLKLARKTMRSTEHEQIPD